jgi:hypothetical protein
VVLLLAVPACSSGTKADAGPTASVTAPSTTADPQAAVKAEVEAAYLKSWDVYLDAIRRVDDGRLEDTHAGAALETVRQEVGDVRATGGWVEGSVDHDYSIEVSGGRATVVDRYVNHLVLYRADGSPAEPDPNRQVEYRYDLERMLSGWRLVGIDRR